MSCLLHLQRLLDIWTLGPASMKPIEFVAIDS